MRSNTRIGFTQHVPLLIVIVIGACLRLYNLGVPSMWWDEALVPLIARFPVGSILEWLRTIEVHPPLFYLLVKPLAAASQTDFVLRLLSALPGIACLYFVYRLGEELVSPLAGLCAAGLLAVNPYALWLSRIVRPYSLYLLLYLVLLWGLVRYRATRAGGYALAVFAATLLLYWTHYMMVVLAPAIGLAVLVMTFPSWRAFLLLAATDTLAFSTVLPFFLLTLRLPHWVGEAPLSEILANAGGSLLKLAWFLPGPLGWVMLALCGLGFVAVRGRPRLVAAGLALCLVPVAIVLAGRLGWTGEPRYFLNFFPVMLLGAGGGLAWLLGRLGPVAARLACLGLTVVLAAVVVNNAREFYGERSLLGMTWISYKQAAAAVPGLVRPGEAVMASEDGLYNALDWHVQRRGRDNPLRAVDVRPTDGEVMVNFLWFGPMGHLAQTKDDLARRYPGLVEVGTVGGLSFLKAVVQRTPVQPAAALPWERTFAGAADILGASHSLRGLVVNPYWGEAAQPAQNDRAGSIEYCVDNLSGQGRPRISLACRYVNAGAGNTLRLLVGYDGGPLREVLSSTGPDRHVYRKVVLDPPRDFRRLLVRVELSCARKTAQYPGGNLAGLQLRGLLVALDAPGGDDPGCGPAAGRP